MIDVITLVNHLEKKLYKLVKRFKKLEQENKDLQLRLETQERNYIDVLQRLEQKKQELSALKNARESLGNETYKRETKAKINMLVKEVEQCVIALKS